MDHLAHGCSGQVLKANRRVKMELGWLECVPSIHEIPMSNLEYCINYVWQRHL